MPVVTFQCRICGKKDFITYDGCDKHEQTCQKTVYFRDDFSGEIISYKNTTKFDQENEMKKNQCHVLRLDKVPEGFSEFAGKDVSFNVTDATLIDMYRLSQEAQIRVFGKVIYVQDKPERY